VTGSFVPRFTDPFKDINLPVKEWAEVPVIFPVAIKTPIKEPVPEKVADPETRQKILHTCVPFVATMTGDTFV
jgi:hypothetical protein